MSLLLTTENTEVTEEVTEKNNSVDAHIIGQIQLEGAIEHYNQGNYICAITLARAADNYLGKLLEYSKNKTPALYDLQNIIFDKYEEEPDLNYIANELKHFKDTFSGKEHRIRLDAIQLICRAITNFIELELPLSGIMSKFSNSHTPAHIDSIINSVPSSVTSVSSVVNKKISEEETNTLSGKIIDCAIQVHKKLGPGLLESAYQRGMAYMMAQANIPFEKEKSISIMIDNLKLDAGYRADFIIADSIILEIKSVDKLIPIHDAQLLTYMRLGHFPLGLLLNFNEQLMKNGIKRLKI